MTSGRRLWYVDSLRAYAVALVFVIHVCEVFNPWDEWHVTNAVRSRVLGEVVVLMAPWIMPLVMLLAGVSAWYALPSRDNATYIGERTRRLLIPLVVGTLLLVPPQVWLERRFRHQFDGSLLDFYPRFFDGIYPSGNFSWHHLWFLGHLYGYSLLALPLFRYLQRRGGAGALAFLGKVSSGRGGLMWLGLPLVLERSLLWGLFPERHMLTSDWSNHALLFVAYEYGFVFAGSERLRTAIDAQWRGALLVALLGTGTLMASTWRDQVPARLPPPYAQEYLAFWVLYAWCAWAWMIALLGMARRWLDRAESPVRRAEPFAYGWYIVHQPVIVAIAFVVVQWRTSVPFKAAILFVASGVATLVVTAMLGRLPVISHALIGMRARGAVAHARAHTA
jgi:glucan biosynthesis protein C